MALRRAIWEDRPDGNAQGFTRDTIRPAAGTRVYRHFRQDGAVYGFFATTFTIPERQWHIVLLTNYRRPYNSLREIASQIVTIFDGGEPTRPSVTLGTRLDSLKRVSGTHTAVVYIRSASCRGTALINETELVLFHGAGNALRGRRALSCTLPAPVGVRLASARRAGCHRRRRHERRLSAAGDLCRTAGVVPSPW